MKRASIIVAIVATLIGVIVNCSSPPQVLYCDPKLGYIECNNWCVMPNTDTENCGRCGNICGPGEACVHGACAVSCPKGNLLCTKDGGSPTCVNSMTDNDNCGACGTSCNNGQICYKGVCSGTCGDSTEGQTVCKPDGGAEYCANLSNDRGNCGGCGNACNAAQVCVAGKCSNECDTTQTLCDNGQGPFCTDTSTDNNNCGGCGNTCNTTGNLEVCSGGACGSSCNALQTLCTGTPNYCANTKSDNQNCGTCGNVCPSNKPFCSSGTCSASAPQGTVYYSNLTTAGVQYVKCGTGAYTNCTSTNAITSCTNIGKKLVVWENYNSTSGVTPLSTQSYEYYPYGAGYYINYDTSLANGSSCLVGFNAVSGYYCTYWAGYGSGYWDGAVFLIPTTTGKQFGYVYSGDTGYQSTFTNSIQAYNYCTYSTSYTASYSSCSTYYVACL
jgi:hypothetical protein